MSILEGRLCQAWIGKFDQPDRPNKAVYGILDTVLKIEESVNFETCRHLSLVTVKRQLGN